MSHDYPISPDGVESDAPLCEYCGMPMHDGPQESAESEQEDAGFCSDACQSAYDSNGASLPDYESESFFYPGVGALDISMPQGMPRDTINLISGSPGTRIHSLLIELAWRALQRDEPVVFVCISDPPIATLREFLALKWNIIPHLESGNLRLIDAYTHRDTGSRDNNAPICGARSAHLRDVTESNDAISYLHDPSQPDQFKRHLTTAADDLGMNCRGTVLFDSLTELGTMMQKTQGYELLKDLRANFAKNRSITLFCGTNFGGYDDEFPHQLEYLFDGLIDLSLNPKRIPGLLVKELLVRKMRGVMTLRESLAYEFMEHDGLMVMNLDGEEDQPPEDADIEDPPNQPDAGPTRGERRASSHDDAQMPPMDDLDPDPNGTSPN